METQITSSSITLPLIHTGTASPDTLVITTNGNLIIGTGSQTSTTLDFPIHQFPDPQVWGTLETAKISILRGYQQAGISLQSENLSHIWTTHYAAYLMIVTWMPSLGYKSEADPTTRSGSREWEQLALKFHRDSDHLHQKMATVVIVFVRLWHTLLG